MASLVRSFSSRPAYAAQGDITRLFNSLFDSATPLATSFAQSGRSFVPALDVVEHADEFVLSADLPGLSEADVKIEVLDDVLTISGERKFQHEDNTDGYRRIERAVGSFSRKLSLPRGVDAGAVKASFSNGVLEIHVPKPEEIKPQRVEIAAGA